MCWWVWLCSLICSCWAWDNSALGSTGSEKWKRSRSVVSDSLWPHRLYLTRLLFHGIFQARILKWVAISSSRGYSQPRSPVLQADVLSSEPLGKPGRVNGELQDSLCQRGFFQIVFASVPAPMVSPCPCGESQLPHTSTGDTPTLAGSFASVSYGVTAPFLWVFVHTEFCLCSSRLDSLFPLVLWKSCNQIQLAFRVRFSGDSFSCWTPRLRRWMWGSDPSQQWEHFFYIIVLQFVVHPPGGNEIWVCYDCAPPTTCWSFFFIFGCGAFFFFFF